MRDLTGTNVNANCRKGGTLYVGSLCFFTDSFEYKAKAVNSTISLGKIPYSDINEIEAANTLGIIPNGIIVKLKNSNELRFNVNNRNAVIEFLKSKME